VHAMESEMATTLDEYTGAQVPAEAQSSQHDASTRGVRKLGLGWLRSLSGGRGPHSHIPERKQVNYYQAFIIVSSLWPFRRPYPRPSCESARAVRERQGR
jgi:hypothetical protein